MQLYIIAILLALAYLADIFSALAVRKHKPGLFSSNEDNRRFIMFLDKFGTKKGVIIYSLTYSLQYLFRFILAGMFTFMLLMNTFSMSGGLELGVAFMLFFHVIAAITNLISLTKKDIPQNTVQINLTIHNK